MRRCGRWRKCRARSIAIALVLAAVFIPVGLMSGIQGRLNQQFAITIAVSVVISAFNALTLSPALVGDAAAAAQGVEGAAGAVLRRVQPLAREVDARIRQSEPRVDSEAGDRAGRAAALRRGHRTRRQSAAQQLPARRGLRLLPAEHPAAAGRVAGAERCRQPEGGRASGEDARRRQLQHHRRVQPDHARDGEQQRVLLRPAEAVGRARRAVAAGARDRQSAQRPVANDRARGDGVRDHAAVDSRPRQPGRVHAVAAGSERRVDRVPRRADCRSSWPPPGSDPSWRA